MGHFMAKDVGVGDEVAMNGSRAVDRQPDQLNECRRPLSHSRRVEMDSRPAPEKPIPSS